VSLLGVCYPFLLRLLGDVGFSFVISPLGNSLLPRPFNLDALYFFCIRRKIIGEYEITGHDSLLPSPVEN